MHKPLSVLKRNETYKILLDFEIQTNHLIPDGMYLVLINNKKIISLLGDITIPANHRVKLKEIEEIHKY